MAEDYPMHVVCDWIGNSQPVALKHYLQVTEDHFAAAVGPVRPEAAPKAAHNTTLRVGMGGKEPELNCDFPEENENSAELLVCQIAEEGLEPPTRGL